MNITANTPPKAFQGLPSSLDSLDLDRSKKGGGDEIPEEMYELVASTLFVIFSNSITMEKPADPPFDMEHTPVF